MAEELPDDLLEALLAVPFDLSMLDEDSKENTENIPVEDDPLFQELCALDISGYDFFDSDSLFEELCAVDASKVDITPTPSPQTRSRTPSPPRPPQPLRSRSPGTSTPSVPSKSASPETPTASGPSKFPMSSTPSVPSKSPSPGTSRPPPPPSPWRKARPKKVEDEQEKSDLPLDCIWMAGRAWSRRDMVKYYKSLPNTNREVFSVTESDEDDTFDEDEVVQAEVDRLNQEAGALVEGNLVLRDYNQETLFTEEELNNFTYRRFRKKLPPNPKIPSDLTKRGIPCHLIGFNNEGYIFIQLAEADTDDEVQEALTRMNEFYSMHPSLFYFNIRLSDISVGEVLIARKEYGENDQFVRVQVIHIDQVSSAVYALDLDYDPQIYKYEEPDLFYVVERVHEIPTLSVQCVLAGTEDFLGTAIISDILRIPNTIKEHQLLCEVVGEKEDSKTERVTPIVVLYYSQHELLTKEWCLLEDIFEMLKKWNSDILDHIDQELVLTSVSITDVDDDCTIFVQLKSPLMQWMSQVQPVERFRNYEAILNSVKALYKKGCRKFMKMVTNGVNRRVEILNEQPYRSSAFNEECSMEDDFESGLPKKFIVRCTDYGEEGVCNFARLLPYSMFPLQDVLQNIPAQGFYAKLHFPGDGDAYLKEHEKAYLRNHACQVRILGFAEYDLPLVIIYYPNENKMTGRFELKIEEESTAVEDDPVGWFYPFPIPNNDSKDEEEDDDDDDSSDSEEEMKKGDKVKAKPKQVPEEQHLPDSNTENNDSLRPRTQPMYMFPHHWNGVLLRATHDSHLAFLFPNRRNVVPAPSTSKAIF